MFILFTDIDGTLTNKYTHSFGHSEIWIKEITNLNIPVVLNSSKTFAEIRMIQNKLEITEPFIFENGSAIAFPITGNKSNRYIPTFIKESKYEIFQLTPAGFDPRSCTQILKQNLKVPFETISTSDPKILKPIIGLSDLELALAAERNYSETYIFSQEVDISIEKINEALMPIEAIAIKGSRFITVTHRSVSKGNAITTFLKLYRNIYTHAESSSIKTIGIGDAANDLPMLRQTDLSFYLTDDLTLAPEMNTLHIIQPSGPEGFIKVCKKIIKGDFHQSQRSIN